MSLLLPKKVPRRAALRGMLGGGAVSVALPFLDCMLNDNGTALAATGKALPVRFGTWYWGMGHTPGHAIQEKRQTEKGITFLSECAALERHRDDLNFFGTFSMPLDGYANYTHFSGWVVGRTGVAPARTNEIPAPTIDLLIADTIGAETRFKTIDVSAAGIARENYSARNTDSRGAAEIDPLALYSRLFGADFVDPNTADFTPDAKIMVERSALSAVIDESRAYMGTIGAADKARLDEYFTSIRQVENQLALQLEAPAPAEACVVPARPSDPPIEQLARVREMPHVIATHKIMAKLVAMAVACNQTRVFNMVFTDNFASVRRQGETYTHHVLTHTELIDSQLGYQPLAYWFNARASDGWADYLDVFKDIKEGPGTLLDNCLIYATTETNYAKLHTIDGVPMWLAGKAGGRVKTGYHVVGGGDPVTRVGFTALRAMGVPIESWGTKSLQTSKLITEIMAS